MGLAEFFAVTPTLSETRNFFYECICLPSFSFSHSSVLWVVLGVGWNVSRTTQVAWEVSHFIYTSNAAAVEQIYEGLDC